MVHFTKVAQQNPFAVVKLLGKITSTFPSNELWISELIKLTTSVIININKTDLQSFNLFMRMW